MSATIRRLPFVLLSATILLGSPARAQKPAVRPADYGRFENLGPGTLSPDGQWLAYGISRVDETTELRVRGLGRDTTLILAQASGAAFSSDSRWLIYTIGVTARERERLERERKPIHNRLGILDLRTLATTEIDRVASAALSNDGRHAAMRGYAPEGTTTAALDLLVRELATGTTTAFGNVTTFSWSDAAPLLAMTVSTESGAGNGVQLFDASGAAIRVLDSSPSTYRGLAWRDDRDDLAVLRSRADSAWKDTTHVILAWRRLRSTAPQALTFDPAGRAAFPAETRIAESRTPQWADDGTSITFGLRPREAAKATSPKPDSAAADSAAAAVAADSAKGDAVKPSDVQVWHAKDFRIFPMQRSQESADQRRTLLAFWRLADDQFVQIGTDLMESAAILEGGRFATETTVEPYRFDAMFGRNWRDIHLIDLNTGQRNLLLEKVRYFSGSSPTGRWLIWFAGEDWWTYDTQKGTRRNITENVDAQFANLDYDYPVEQYPPFGVAGWTTGDRALLVYDAHDVWSVAPDGSAARRLTAGASDSTVHRYVRVRRAEESIDLTKPVFLSVTGEWSKKSGYAVLRPGRMPERLVFEDRAVTRLARADSADVFLFAQEAFDDSPDWFVAGAQLANPRQVSATNPFHTDHAWGRSELIEYTSESGRRLQGSLHYPAGWQSGRRYPMIVYQYERLSQNVHRWVTPSERSYYNISVFTSEGYFVLQPDIVYRAREPGRSAVEAIVPAVKTVVERGLVDPERVGLVGHSWGGYQATYVPTQTNIFAAAVAGAPITNYLSFMGAVHWSGGLPETSHWETGQARMDVPYWEDFEAHVRNSPAAFIHRLETPMLMMFGDADGTVDWHQGVEFYNFARRAGRNDFVMLVYPGEDHGLRKKENQIDYQRRILQWFGHWLKGDPAPKWMTDGVTFMERKAVIENGAAR